ncbi:MAG: glycosyltransferase, partial [Candidatus Omnitrophica bacterium]|nr:glycosyltransferase [Candidatus Omnitrophota bacterium]
MSHCRLSLIIPTYNDAFLLEKNIPRLTEFLQSKSITYEIIIVDDGSENSQAVRDFAEQSGCRCYVNEKNQGKGAVVRKGMLEAEGEFCLYTDVDIPFEFEAIELFLRYLDEKEFDMAVGDRTLPESQYFHEISFLRKVGSHFFSFIVGRFVVGGFFDTQCGLKGFRAAVARDLFSNATINSFAFDVELLYIALKRNYDIKRLPVRLRSNET